MKKTSSSKGGGKASKSTTAVQKEQKANTIPVSPKKRVVVDYMSRDSNETQVFWPKVSIKRHQSYNLLHYIVLKVLFDR